MIEEGKQEEANSGICLHGLLLIPEDTDSTLLRNVYKFLSDYTASHLSKIEVLLVIVTTVKT
jgi:hypothetical protein